MERNFKVNGPRFLMLFDALAKFGFTSEGLDREANTPAFFEARDFLKKEMEASGLATRIDAAGNLFGVLPGNGSCKTKILSGSHLDSVIHGGAFDGALGIVAALEAVRTLKDLHYVPRHSIEVVAFNAEEGGPLGGTFGSRVFAGLLKRKDVPEEILRSFDMDFDSLEASRADAKEYHASIELHIEQGPVLWDKEIPIGIPTGIVGISRHSVRITGLANHAGTTPMCRRKDAMQSAVRTLNQWFAWMKGRQEFVCNVGKFDLLPGHASIVPACVSFVLELRSMDSSIMKKAAEAFQTILEEEKGCTVEMHLLGEKPPVFLDGKIVSVIRSVCEERGFRFVTMPSGASHDSSPLAKVMPSGMIFVPSANGVSHAKEEHTSKEDMLRGLECLTDTILKLDGL